MARWLLRCRTLAGRDELDLTQEFLAEMLGIRRTSVSGVANRARSGGCPLALEAELSEATNGKEPISQPQIA
jgi:hypothetical protein